MLFSFRLCPLLLLRTISRLNRVRARGILMPNITQLCVVCIISVMHMAISGESLLYV
jgi:hypothetical protein